MNNVLSSILIYIAGIFTGIVVMYLVTPWEDMKNE